MLSNAPPMHEMSPMKEQPEKTQITKIFKPNTVKQGNEEVKDPHKN
jgi:hypothetical protein